MMISNLVFPQYDLEVEITNLKNNKGLVMMQLFDENHNLISQQKGTITEKKSVIIIKNLKASGYAICFFHDENLNGNLETNRIGKPTEGYGFSNNAYSTFGPKPFKNWIFEMRGNKKILLKTNY